MSASAGAEIGTMKAWNSIEPFRTIPNAEEGCGEADSSGMASIAKEVLSSKDLNRRKTMNLRDLDPFSAFTC